jgi:hypothetical protein
MASGVHENHKLPHLNCNGSRPDKCISSEPMKGSRPSPDDSSPAAIDITSRPPLEEGSGTRLSLHISADRAIEEFVDKRDAWLQQRSVLHGRHCV